VNGTDATPTVGQDATMEEELPDVPEELDSSWVPREVDPEGPMGSDPQPRSYSSALPLWNGKFSFWVGSGSTIPLTELRGELREAQRKDPRLSEIVNTLEGKPFKDFLADPRRDAFRVKERSTHYVLDREDGLLCQINLSDLDPEDAVPVAPQGLYQGRAKCENAPPNMTWPALLCGMVHFTPNGGHANSVQMVDTLWGSIIWGDGRRQMRKDASTCYLRCRGCSAAKRPAKVTARLRSKRARRPFVKIQIDLYEITPEGKEGEKAVLTVTCTYAKFPYFRAVKSKEASEVASQLFDIFLDMGCIPLIVQSDMGSEFINALMRELVGLLGSTQIFSTAVHPQSQGIIERVHKDMTALLGQLIRELVELRPRTWPKYLRVLEARVRDKSLGDSGVTPRALVCGWFAITPLMSSLAAVNEIPADLPHEEFNRALVRDVQEISKVFDEWEAEEHERMEAWYNEEKRAAWGILFFWRRETLRS